VLASNTSGLGIDALAGVLPEALRHRFCGVHFFNPPRYMHLAELHSRRRPPIPRSSQALESFLVTTLGKGVVIAKDTPNFIGNRIGVFSMLAAMHHTEQGKLGLRHRRCADRARRSAARSRRRIAPPMSSAWTRWRTSSRRWPTRCRTIRGMRISRRPAWLQALVRRARSAENGAASTPSAARTSSSSTSRRRTTVLPTATLDPDVAALLKERDPAKKFAALRASAHPQAQFLWNCFRDTFHYSAYHLADIADTARDVDLALRWGYGWSLGPFETWQAAGWKQVADWIAEDIVGGKAMSNAPLPDWVFDGRDGVHAPTGSFSPARNAMVPRSDNPVYARQRFPRSAAGRKSRRRAAPCSRTTACACG
jgi:3-hydroxyacyl-CoA dehydrogenase